MKSSGFQESMPMGQGPHHPTVSALLRSRYALADVRLERISGGHSTQNYHAVDSSGSEVFVKVYPEGWDVRAEQHAIALTRWAGAHGVPTARLRESMDGELLACSGAVALSVWEWVPGDTVSSGFTPAEQAMVGQALGRIHAVFAHHRRSRTLSPWLEEWFSADLRETEARIDSLLGVVAGRDCRDEFDVIARSTLTDRRIMLAQVPALLAGLPRDLGTQVLHGDFTPPNLLFDEEGLAAVIDFRPPVPYMLAFELGRIAFDPRTVVLDEGWIDSAARLLTAYLRENTEIARRDVLVCGRVILVQMLRSLYGVEQHYLNPDPRQAALDEFWQLRHRAAGRLLENLEEVEAMLRDVSRRR
ncbi:phosphotransferase enzyme family protein [Nocardiopsis ganjiahuensis]|uniref:phosphotransferase enzyme family protein n=1 Tax=Nocardiopsis ganjiahuensis TaxID=239984 RepID=UPI003084426C